MKKRILVALLFLLTLTLAAYEVIVFGDFHFDSNALRDPKGKHPRCQTEETKRNLAAWSPERTPALLDRAAKKVNPETALVLQLGDLVQGDFGSKSRHQKALDLVLAEMLKRFPEHPFVMIPGNHDYRGPGAQEGYQEKIVPYLNKTLKLSLRPGKPVQYAWTKERDLFLMLDCNNPDPAFPERTVASYPNLRHLIVLTHFPVIPTSYPGAVYWRKMSDAERRKFIALLAKHNAIVLTAHIHKATHVRWQCPAGTITQLSFFSIFPGKTAPRRITKRNVKEPLGKFPQKAPKTAKPVQSEFLPGYRLFEEVQPAAGFTILKLDDQGVTAELYNARALKPTCRIRLR